MYVFPFLFYCDIMKFLIEGDREQIKKALDEFIPMCKKEFESVPEIKALKKMIGVKNVVIKVFTLGRWKPASSKLLERIKTAFDMNYYENDGIILFVPFNIPFSKINIMGREIKLEKPVQKMRKNLEGFLRAKKVRIDYVKYIGD